MYHREDQLDADYGATTLEDKLDTMESFVRVTPMPIKSGEMVFLCNCAEAYKYYACVHSGVLSMLWNEDMKFPDTERAHPLKAKEAKKSQNPFEAVAKRKQVDKDKLSVSSAQTDPKIVWRPNLPSYTPPVESSGASMAVKGKCLVPAPPLPLAVMPCPSFTADASFADFFLALQAESSDVPAAVDVLARTEEGGKKKADRLQHPVDPKLLVSSKSRGPTPRRHIPTHIPPKRKVCLHHASYTCRALPDYLHSQRQRASASQPLPLELEKAGGKRARSVSPYSGRETRSKHRAR